MTRVQISRLILLPGVHECFLGKARQREMGVIIMASLRCTGPTPFMCALECALTWLWEKKISLSQKCWEPPHMVNAWNPLELYDLPIIPFCVLSDDCG